MSSKRSRTNYEADHDSGRLEAPFVLFGTEISAEGAFGNYGSFVPLHKQEVRDERGRKRLHGAFTGGWSAGYFNTVGSKDGWAPSGFVSSRTNRRMDEPELAVQRPEDFMDEEDLADQAESQTVHTAQAFAGLGKDIDTGGSRDSLADLIRIRGETMGTRLLRRMGWRDGQGTGPKVARQAQTRDDPRGRGSLHTDRNYYFAPDDVAIAPPSKKADRHGIGFGGSAKALVITKKQTVGNQGGIAVGILNGSDEDDDPYEAGPKISYNRAAPAARKSKKSASRDISTKHRSNPTATGPNRLRGQIGRPGTLRLCHDGRVPIEGFILSRRDGLATTSAPTYPLPCVPPGWVPARQTRTDLQFESGHCAQSVAHDQRSRAHILGETPLPGKSVFDFMTAAARDKLAVATGNQNLPTARGDVLPSGQPTGLTIHGMHERAPRPDPDTAAAALARDRGGKGPYESDAQKRLRYRQYLEFCAGLSTMAPQRPTFMNDRAFAMELQEFYNCARIFKPMTGFMASRFTTSTSGISNGKLSSLGTSTGRRQLSVSDTATDAAKQGMFGPITRSMVDFYPSRLLCKRFDVTATPHVMADEHHSEAEEQGAFPTPAHLLVSAPHIRTRSEKALETILASTTNHGKGTLAVEGISEPNHDGPTGRPPDHVFKDIFGGSSDEER